MLNHDRTFFSRLLFAAVIALSFGVLFTPASGVPTAPPGTDKLVHFALFAALAGTGGAARFPLRGLAVGLVCYAGVSEVLQAALPLGRSGDLLDAAVDMVGVAVGCVLWQRLVPQHRGTDEWS